MSEQDALRCMPGIDGLQCALCNQLLQAPVAAGDGYSYCRHCILEWYRMHDRQNRVLASPTTNEPLADRLLLPNLTLRDAIRGIQCRAAPAWNEAEKERVALCREVQTLSRKIPAKDALDPRVADAQAEANQFRVQLANTQQEVQRLQIELERHHKVMKHRDASARDIEIQAHAAGLAAELKSCKTEVTRLQDELEKTRAQAKNQAEKLEGSLVELHRLARIKAEYSGNLPTKPARDGLELEKARAALAESLVKIADLQAQLVTVRQAASPPCSPTALELPPESLLQADLAQMKQALCRQDTIIADLQTQITAVRAERRRWQDLCERREQRRLEAEDEVLRLRNELATTARHNLMRSELERTAEVVTQEAERLEKELLHVQGQLQQSNGRLAELASCLGVPDVDSSDVARDLISKVRSLEAQLQECKGKLGDIASAAGVDNVELVFRSIDGWKEKVHETSRDLYDRDQLLAEAAAGIADFLEILGLGSLGLPKGGAEAARAALQGLDAAEEAAARMARAAKVAKQTAATRRVLSHEQTCG
ncbi:PUB35 [Symbiodinium necroappetens]|uniref:PUB35 protein n=1 Tax=Symbiodinium necroappetens TaxID=1628268 RepID=A0A813AZ27_9DINO|nr:PUB35 [Symbiodinium necroappetens]